MYKEGLLAGIDPNSLSNLKYIVPQAYTDFMKNGQVTNIAVNFGQTAIAYRTDKGMPIPHSWLDLEERILWTCRA